MIKDPKSVEDLRSLLDTDVREIFYESFNRVITSRLDYDIAHSIREALDLASKWQTLYQDADSEIAKKIEEAEYDLSGHKTNNYSVLQIEVEGYIRGLKEAYKILQRRIANWNNN